MRSSYTVFEPVENYFGMKHLLVRLWREITRRPADFFLTRWQPNPRLKVEPAYAPDGTLDTCQVCGYSIAMVELPNGWRLTTCSALPVIRCVTDAELDSWLAELPAVKLPMSRL